MRKANQSCANHKTVPVCIFDSSILIKVDENAMIPKVFIIIRDAKKKGAALEYYRIV